jgi:hypothetical protein
MLRFTGPAVAAAIAGLTLVACHHGTAGDPGDASADASCDPGFAASQPASCPSGPLGANPSCAADTDAGRTQLANAPDTFGVSRLGTPQKLYQLLGETDRQFQPPQPTPIAATESGAGVVGADLGFSFQHRGRLVFLFGDTIPTPGAASAQSCCATGRVGEDACCTGARPRDADSMAFLDDPASASGDAPLALRYPLASDGYFQPVTLDGNERCTNEVPASGFSDGTSMYVFYEVDTADCRGYAVLAVSTDDGPTLRTVLTMPYPLSDVAPRIVATSAVPGLSSLWGDAQTLLMWGRYRVHPPILVAAPLSRVTDPTSWRYLASLGGDTPTWDASIDAAVEVYTPGPGYDCRGPFTVVPVPEARRWLMIEQEIEPSQSPTRDGWIRARVAASPVGPWSPPLTLFDMNADGGICGFMHRRCLPAPVDTCDEAMCEAREEAGAVSASTPCCDDDYTPSMFGFGPCGTMPYPYGAFPVEALSRWDAPSSTLTLYSLLSTFNPYTTVMTKTQLSFAPGSPLPRRR